jgi:hypothetical protein
MEKFLGLILWQAKSENIMYMTTDVQILQKLYHYFDVQNTDSNKAMEMDRISSHSYWIVEWKDGGS